MTSVRRRATYLVLLIVVVITCLVALTVGYRFRQSEHCQLTRAFDVHPSSWKDRVCTAM